MRHDLVNELHGHQIRSVPLFRDLQLAVFTELCIALAPMPCLKADIVCAEGDYGTEMYIVSSGTLRVTQHVPPTAKDDERVRAWVEAVLATAHSR
jgi:hypothetical protein